MSIKQSNITPKIFIDQTSDHQGKLQFDFLAPGYGHTIGNSLRRVLISSIEGYAITAIKLPNGVLHEFDTIPGVIQDVSEIILNLKKVRFKKTGSENQEKLTISFNNQVAFKAGDLAKISAHFEVLNPDLEICTMDETANFQLELKVEKGHGYMGAEEQNIPSETVGHIPIDAIFTPIKNVQYQVENTLVGQRIDYEKIIMEIKTDGSITPKKALQNAAQKIIDHFSQFIAKDALNDTKDTLEEEPTEDKKTILMRKKLQKSVREIGFSVRTYNSLTSQNIKNLGDLVKKSLPQLMLIRNFGKKSLQEVKDLLKKEGLSLGMDTRPYQTQKEEIF